MKDLSDFHAFATILVCSVVVSLFMVGTSPLSFTKAEAKETYGSGICNATETCIGPSNEECEQAVSGCTQYTEGLLCYKPGSATCLSNTELCNDTSACAAPCDWFCWDSCDKTCTTTPGVSCHPNPQNPTIVKIGHCEAGECAGNISNSCGTMSTEIDNC